MTKYEFLLELQASGELRTLVKNGFLSPHYLTWMEIYQYHLEHPKESQWQVSEKFNTNKRKVWNAYQLMNEELMR